MESIRDTSLTCPCNAVIGRLLIQNWSTFYRIKSPRLLRAALDCECFLITDKHTEILDFILLFLSNSAFYWFIVLHVHRQTDKRTDGHYQTYYLTCFVVDNNNVYVSDRGSIKTYSLLPYTAGYFLWALYSDVTLLIIASFVTADIHCIHKISFPYPCIFHFQHNGDIDDLILDSQVSVTRICRIRLKFYWKKS